VPGAVLYFSERFNPGAARIGPGNCRSTLGGVLDTLGEQIGVECLRLSKTETPVQGDHVASVSVSLRYRPIRLGLCVRSGNWDDLNQALRLTHTLWGGKFNPVIPVEHPGAKLLVDKFRVDVLYPIARIDHLTDFAKAFSHLPWPASSPPDEYLVGHLDGCNPLDILHPVLQRRWQEPLEDDFHPEEGRYGVVVRWQANDPLSFILLATFGAPSSEEALSLWSIIRERSWFRDVNLKSDDPIPGWLVHQITPSAVTSLDLQPEWAERHGFFVGDAGKYADVVTYWNLRASNVNVMFFDPKYETRLHPVTQAHMKRWFTSSVSKETIPTWSRLAPESYSLNLGSELPVEPQPATDEALSNLDIQPPLHYISEKTVLGTTFESDSGPTLAVAFPEKPFTPPMYSGEEMKDQLVVSLTNSFDADQDRTFWTPFVPELNLHYARRIRSHQRFARAEPDGLGIICDATDEYVSWGSVDKKQLVSEIFGAFGIDSEPSPAGRVAANLIHQLGGLRGCWVLRIGGVRELIRHRGPLDTFERTEAMHAIRGAGQSGFKQYELLLSDNLVGGKKLKPEDAFLYLLERGVFRVGLKLQCPNCDLDFWLPLDELRSHVVCEVCARHFNITRQLRDRDWAYRRSGLFGKFHEGEGSIPVALTLYELHRNLSAGRGHHLIATSMKLRSKGRAIPECETDFVLVVQDGGAERVQLALGECKSPGGTITQRDVLNLGAVASALPESRFDVYLVFSKTGQFSAEETENCRKVPDILGGRVILLSDIQLEWGFGWDRELVSMIKSSASRLVELYGTLKDLRSGERSLAELARITEGRHFDSNRI
jgi:hypothetical protein